MTAAAAARLGPGAVLVLGGDASPARPGHLALGAALGARVVVVPDPADAGRRDPGAVVASLAR